MAKSLINFESTRGAKYREYGILPCHQIFFLKLSCLSLVELKILREQFFVFETPLYVWYLRHPIQIRHPLFFPDIIFLSDERKGANVGSQQHTRKRKWPTEFTAKATGRIFENFLDSFSQIDQKQLFSQASPPYLEAQCRFRKSRRISKFGISSSKLFN